MKKALLFFLLGLFSGPLSIFAQNPTQSSPFHCGTSVEDQQVLYKNMVELRNRYPNGAISRAVTYVPVWFHLVAKTDGTGRTTQANVGEMLCGWNKLYENNGLEIQFYIKGFSDINLDALYNGPQSFDGTNRMKATRKTDAMNVYLTNNAGDGSNPSEIVLAYYSNKSTTADADYSNDWIVCINSQVNRANAFTIAHEAGHFLSLPHTFFGWEANGPFMPTAASPCAPVSLTLNGRVVLVEKVARTGTSKNCNVAADGFCDTPEDYLFGLGATTCNYAGIAKDPNCVSVNPDETNIMGYFLGCMTFFSTEQKTAMRNNLLNHQNRAYLRNNSVTPPLTATIPTLVSPATGATTPYFNNIRLDWADVAGALGYWVDVSRFPTFGSAIKGFYVTASEVNVNSANASVLALTAGGTYYWRVRAIVPYKTCDNLSATGNFKTGTLNAVNEIEGITHFSVSPNPLSKSQLLSLQMTSETDFDAHVKLFNSIGQLIKTERRHFTTGVSSQEMSVSDVANGIYILTIESEKGVLNKRIVIQ